jgi:hypothetical protein
MRRNGRDAPIPDLPVLTRERGGSTLSDIRPYEVEPYNARTAFHDVVVTRGAQSFLS